MNIIVPVNNLIGKYLKDACSVKYLTFCNYLNSCGVELTKECKPA